ncbi:MAG: ASPIC/UnbV domain-containing protein, partial [Verrucomicrobiales bacterium]
DSFVDVSFASGTDIDSDSRSVVAADFNRDGACDLLVGSVGGGPLRLFLNRYPAGNFVRVRLQGTTSNRLGIGARLVAHAGKKIVRDVFPANGFMGQGPVETIIGIGDATEIERLEVRWPSGKTQTFANLPAGGSVELREDDGKGSGSAD